MLELFSGPPRAERNMERINEAHKRGGRAAAIAEGLKIFRELSRPPRSKNQNLARLPCHKRVLTNTLLWQLASAMHFLIV